MPGQQRQLTLLTSGAHTNRHHLGLCTCMELGSKQVEGRDGARARGGGGTGTCPGGWIMDHSIGSGSSGRRLQFAVDSSGSHALGTIGIDSLLMILPTSAQAWIATSGIQGAQREAGPRSRHALCIMRLPGLFSEGQARKHLVQSRRPLKTKTKAD